MDIGAVEKRYQIKIHQANPLIATLCSRIRRYEQQYKMSSIKMLTALRRKKVAENEDVCSWMHDYRNLQKLRNGGNGVTKIGTVGTH